MVLSIKKEETLNSHYKSRYFRGSVRNGDRSGVHEKHVGRIFLKILFNIAMEFAQPYRHAGGSPQMPRLRRWHVKRGRATMKFPCQPDLEGCRKTGKSSVSVKI